MSDLLDRLEATINAMTWICAHIFSRSVNLVLDQRLAFFVVDNAFDSLRDLLAFL